MKGSLLMDQKLLSFINSLEELKKVIDSANINKQGFQAHGWNQVHLKKENIAYILSNYISKLKLYGDCELTENLEGIIELHTENIDLLIKTSQSYFTNNSSHLIHSVPSILLTLNTIFSDIDYELFSYENIQDKNLLPKNLSRRIRSISSKINSIEESSESLTEKIHIINDAHESAESLPTDLASLQEAKIELDGVIKKARQEFIQVKEDLKNLHEEAVGFKNDTKKSSEEVENFKINAQASADKASKLVEECDDALQITTTQGLAAGFDQKAQELRRSIWVWIVGLLIALGVGAWIGTERVEAFTEILNHQLTAGQAILHSIMSIFSIGAPLWLAWISTQQINQRFKLAEDYAYKATVAKSFTGFKKFSERFEASTEERLFNSTLDRLDEMPLRLIENKDYNSPWHEFTDSQSFKNAINMFPDLIKDAGRFADRTNLDRKSKQIKPEVKVSSQNENTAVEKSNE